MGIILVMIIIVIKMIKFKTSNGHSEVVDTRFWGRLTVSRISISVSSGRKSASQLSCFSTVALTTPACLSTLSHTLEQYIWWYIW